MPEASGFMAAAGMQSSEYRYGHHQGGTLGVVMGTSGVVATAMNSFGKNGGKLQFFCNNAAGNTWRLAVSFRARIDGMV